MFGVAVLTHLTHTLWKLLPEKYICATKKSVIISSHLTREQEQLFSHQKSSIIKNSGKGIFIHHFNPFQCCVICHSIQFEKESMPAAVSLSKSWSQSNSELLSSILLPITWEVHKEKVLFYAQP